MKTTSRKPALISMALGIAFGTTLAFISANADEMGYWESYSHLGCGPADITVRFAHRYPAAHRGE